MACRLCSVWLLLSFSPFLVPHPAIDHGTYSLVYSLQAQSHPRPDIHFSISHKDLLGLFLRCTSHFLQIPKPPLPLPASCWRERRGQIRFPTNWSSYICGAGRAQSVFSYLRSMCVRIERSIGSKARSSHAPFHRSITPSPVRPRPCPPAGELVKRGKKTRWGDERMNDWNTFWTTSAPLDQP